MTSFRFPEKVFVLLGSNIGLWLELVAEIRLNTISVKRPFY